MQVKYDLVVDFARPNKSNTILISEGDTNSRVCHFTLLNNKHPMSMGDVTVATVRGVKSDGTTIFGDATILVDDEDNKINEIEYVVPSAITDTTGKVTMTITLLSSSNEQITSFEFYLQIRNALYNEDDLISESDLTGFRDLLNRCMVALEKIEAMSESTSLPCPYPLNISIEGESVAYNGSSTVDVGLSGMAYISEGESEGEDPLDESAASSAAASANAAAESLRAVNAAKADTLLAAETATTKAGEASAAKTSAENYAGQASGYATQAREYLEQIQALVGNNT